MVDTVFWWVGAVICLGLGPIAAFGLAVWLIWACAEEVMFRLHLKREFIRFWFERYKAKHPRKDYPAH